MLERLAEIDWAALPRPPGNRTNDAPDALRSVAEAATESEADSAANALLSAVGNNHAGTYYPIVLEVVPCLREILEGGAAWPRTAALNVLIDLVGTFEPADGHDIVPDGSGTVQLEHALCTAVSDMRPLINRIATSSSVDREQQLLASELDEILEECSGRSAEARRNTNAD